MSFDLKPGDKAIFTMTFMKDDDKHYVAITRVLPDRICFNMLGSPHEEFVYNASMDKCCFNKITEEEYAMAIALAMIKR